jgi:predicted ABC-type ATPase
MTHPRLVVVAGPPGSGKSRQFPVDGFGIDGFNVDLRAAALNGGSARAIPRDLRVRAQKECEAFVEGHIARAESYAVETTLRTTIAIEQARRARSAGFEASMIFVCAGPVEACMRRVRIRGLASGHAAPEAELREIYARSLANLLAAIDAFERIELYDNSVWLAAPRRVGRITGGRFNLAVDPPPDWVPEQILHRR